ncbi:MAG: transglutaminase domain-containing protein, partial [Aristaeellaceae bacterium]
SGYARALTLLCRLAGIPCQTVSGTARAGDREERHAWCVLYIGGSFTQTDPTWNDQDKTGLITHWYFNLTDAQMAADHSPDEDTLALPCTDDSLSWHARNGLIVPADAEKARAIIDEAMENMVRRGETVNLRFEQAEDVDAFIGSVRDWIADYNEIHPDAPYEGSWSAISQMEQGCAIIMPKP